MNIVKTAVGLSLTLALAAPVAAIDVPTGYSITHFKTAENSFSGAAISTEQANPNNTVFHPIHVFSHLDYEVDSYLNQSKVDKGMMVASSVVVTTRTNAYNESVMEVCYLEPIPTNASVLVFDMFSYSYVSRSVDIPSYRSDRFCMDAPYMTLNYPDGSSSSSTEFVVIVE